MLVVAPFTGAWIEMQTVAMKRDFLMVAPFTGAWIEIVKQLFNPSDAAVAPFTGAWIEIQYRRHCRPAPQRRTLHGCVD